MTRVGVRFERPSWNVGEYGPVAACSLELTAAGGGRAEVELLAWLVPADGERVEWKARPVG